MHKDLQIKDYDTAVYRGVDDTDAKAIQLALQNGEKLIITRYGHIYDSHGRWIADGMRREKNSEKVLTLTL